MARNRPIYWLQSSLAWIALLTAAGAIFWFVGVLGYVLTERRGNIAAILIVAITVADAFLIAITLWRERRAQSRVGGPTARIEGAIEIARPCADVFAFVADVRNDTHWSTGSVRILSVAAGPPSVGARYSEVYRVRGRTKEARLEITAYEPITHFAVRGKVGFRQVTVSYTFAPIGGGTLLTTETEWPTSRLSFPLNWLNTLPSRRQERAQLSQLKRVLEGETPAAR